MTAGINPELIRRLRQRFEVPDDLATDEELLRLTDNTLTRALVELGIAKDNLVEEATKERGII